MLISRVFIRCLTLWCILFLTISFKNVYLFYISVLIWIGSSDLLVYYFSIWLGHFFYPFSSSLWYFLFLWGFFLVYKACISFLRFLACFYVKLLNMYTLSETVCWDGKLLCVLKILSSYSPKMKSLNVIYLGLFLGLCLQWQPWGVREHLSLDKNQALLCLL